MAEKELNGLRVDKINSILDSMRDDPEVLNARVQIYKNGVPSPHNSSPGTLYSNDSFNIKPVQGKLPVRFGTQDLESFLIGQLDEVAIYGYVLSSAQILSHFKAGMGS